MYKINALPFQSHGYSGKQKNMKAKPKVVSRMCSVMPQQNTGFVRARLFACLVTACPFPTTQKWFSCHSADCTVVSRGFVILLKAIRHRVGLH